MRHILIYIHPVFDGKITIETDSDDLKKRLKSLDKLDVKRVQIDFDEKLGGGWFMGRPYDGFLSVLRREKDGGK